MLFQKLSVADCPLYLRLLAGPDTDVLSFVLKENETGEVEVGPGPLACCSNTHPLGGHGWALVDIVITTRQRWGLRSSSRAGK